MGQICAKCKGSEEPEEEVTEQADQLHSEGPLLEAALPPAAESPVKQSPQAEESPKSTPAVAKSPEAASPVLESPEPKSSLPESSEEVAKSSVVEFPAGKSAPQDVPVPISPQSGGSRRSLLPPSIPDASSIITPPEGEYLNFPILQDVKTIEYVQKSKVMVILKGLPGSGKSYLANTLKQLYKDAVICSADYYFMKSGKYQFKAEELNLAHESCQESAKKAAIRGTSMIIIDNTNLRSWNYKHYLSLSKEYHYTPLIMEPQTPWAKNTKELATRNSHGVKKDVLDQKLKTYETALPLYYWWFLNEADSAQIISVAQDWLRKALQVQSFFQDFSKFSKLSSVEEMLSYYRKNEGHTDYRVLHATVCVVRRGKGMNAKEYMAKKIVKDSYGMCFTLQLIGFVITPRTFGVRLRLGEDALELWGVDDHETETEDTDSRQTSKASQGSAKEDKRVRLANTSVRRDSCQTTFKKGQSLLCDDRFCPTAGRGSRAHLTLGCAPGVRAKTTGFDIMKVVIQEQDVMKTKNHHASEKIQTFSLSEGVLRTYGDSIWVIYPEKEVYVNSLFSAFY